MFALAAGVAAVGGGLSVLSTQIVYPDVFDWQVSANALIVTLLGGVGLFSGPVVGAVVLGLIDFYVGKLTTDTLLVEGAGAAGGDPAGAPRDRLAAPQNGGLAGEIRPGSGKVTVVGRLSSAL